MWCPRCGAEYRAGFSHCPDCDVDLVDTPPAPPPATTTDVEPDRSLIEYPLDDLSDDQRELLEFMLRGDALPFRWEPPYRLVVPAASSDRVNEILDVVDERAEVPPEVEEQGSPVKLAARSRRFLAAMIDGAVLVLTELPFRHLGWLPPLLIAFTYQTCTVALWGRGLGKLVFRIRVARFDGRSTPSWDAAAIRALTPALLTIAFGIVGLTTPLPLVPRLLVTVWALAVYLPIFGADRRGLHDRIANTHVVADYRTIL